MGTGRGGSLVGPRCPVWLALRGGSAAMGRSTFLPGSLERCWRAAESRPQHLPGEKELLG